MPNLDGGHYFLTAILPIDNRGIVEHEGLKSSPIHMVREALEVLPTALQSPASVKIGIQSPFARTTRTHFARFVVLDDPYYNGRDPADSILTAIAGTDLLSPQPVDSLACPYLLFCADFDPEGDEPQSYLEELWRVAERELTTVFQYCYGFDTVKDPAGFARFVIGGQVETTMPFNDYWTIAPPFPSLSMWTLAAAPFAAAAIGLGAAFVCGWPVVGWWGVTVGLIVGSVIYDVLMIKRSGKPGAEPLPLAALAVAPGIALLIAVAIAVWAGWAVLGVLVLTLGLMGVAVYADYAIVMAAGAKPLAAAPNSSLRHVLKALYLQQAFTRFAAAHQGDDEATLQAAFMDFVAKHRPSDLSHPTQPPGVIRSIFPEAPHA